MSHIPRSLDRRQDTTSRDFPLSLPNGEQLAEDRRKQPERRKNGFISRLGLFRQVSYSAVEPLLEDCRQLNLSPGDTLLQPGQPNHHLYLLLDGQLGVHIESPDANNGFVIQAGESAGEISIIDGMPVTAYVVADVPCRVLAVPEKLLWSELFSIPAVARNFLRQVAARFRDRNQAMQEALEQQLRWENLQKELKIANSIQASMLPNLDDPARSYPEVDLCATMTPASQVGGDFYDGFRLPGRRLCLAIGDVSGKGVPASLFMMRSMTLLREEVRHEEDLSAAVCRLNLKLCRNNDMCMFTTLIVGILDIDQARFHYVNAGHNRPLLGRAGRDFDYQPSPGGILVGVNEKAEYPQGVIDLAENDVLVLYSDGVTEAMDTQGRVYSDQRLLDLLNEEPPNGAAQTVARIEAGVRCFVNGAPPSDDLTLLVLRLKQR